MQTSAHYDIIQLSIWILLVARRQEALQLSEQVVEARKNILGEEHLDALHSIHNLAIKYSEARRRQEPLQLMEQVVEAENKDPRRRAS